MSSQSLNTYEEVISWMFTRLPMYQRQGKAAFKSKLDNSRAFSAHLGHPERSFKSIHIAGTNGKGSTSHMIASVLQEAGYKTGLYTSPHLKDFRERIKINGKLIPQASVKDFIRTHRNFLEEHELSFFEMTVAMAFDHFSKQKVDIAVIETGLGGRLDSTNIITPVLSVITNIGFDHMDMLGDTLEKIAGEKAGIIKDGVPVVIGEYHPETFPVFEQKAREKKANLLLVRDFDQNPFQTDLKGAYQSKNLQTAYVALTHLSGFDIEERNLQEGLGNVVRNTGLQGRWQQLKTNPTVICDVAHNKEGLALALEQLNTYSFRSLRIVLGVVKDKDLTTILPLFPKKAIYYFCKPNVPRGLEVAILQEKAAVFELKGLIFNSVSAAYKQALKDADVADLIYIGGSTFTVAEII
ncbi:bifunctional folylpolyglutamate synthase/dihydrofolate synthase [Flavobacteriaceae bacterium M23B6Z8]